MATKMINLIQSQIDLLNDTLKALKEIPKTVAYQTASGYWLDMLNRLIGGTERPSNSYSDQELRSRMTQKIKMNTGCGTFDSVRTACRYYLYLNNNNTWDSIKDVEVGLYCDSNYLIIEASGDNITSRDKLKEIQNFIPVGVGVLIVEIFDNNTFQFYNGDGVTVDYATGFGTITNSNIGGKLAGIIYKGV